MERTRSLEVASRAGQRVRVAGWLHALRLKGGIGFATVRDGWGLIQAVFEHAEAAALAAAAPPLESVVAIEGLATLNPRAPGGVELTTPALTVLEPALSPPPLPLHQPKISAGQSVLLDAAVVANRHPARRAVFRLAAGAMTAFRAVLSAQGFTEVQTPKIVAGATESGANVFELGYFGSKAYLAQSPQFYKQVMVGVFERVFEVGKVFRAEPHDTPRHLNEYVSLDAELGFIESHVTVMAVLREVLAGVMAHLAAHHAPDLALAGVALPEVPAVIPHVHFTEAKGIARARTGVDETGEPDLSPAEERALGAWAREAHASEFLFVTGYPMRKRPFYTHPEPGAPEYSNSFDLLFRGTELVTGGQRLHRYDEYVAALARAGLPAEPFAWYLEAFRHGMPPHGGFAIGLERLLAQLAGLPNVRLAALFPRDMHRVTP